MSWIEAGTDVLLCARCEQKARRLYASDETPMMICEKCLAEEYHRHKDDDEWWGDPVPAPEEGEN